MIDLCAVCRQCEFERVGDLDLTTLLNTDECTDDCIDTLARYSTVQKS